LRLEADNHSVLTVRISYNPSDYPPAEDQGVFVLESNAQAERDEEKPQIKVSGRTAVPLIELIPLYPPCQDDGVCKSIDSRLACVADPPSQQKLCRQNSKATPLLKFPLTSKGKTTRRTFLLRSKGELSLRVAQIQPGPTTSADYRVDLRGIQFPLLLNPGEEKEIAVEYTPSDDQEDQGKVEVISNAGNLSLAPLLLEAASRGCNLEVSPRAIRFPAPRSVQVTAYNQGNEACLLKKIFLKGGKGTPFSLFPAPPVNQAIAPNGRIDFLVKFEATDRQTQRRYSVR